MAENRSTSKTGMSAKDLRGLADALFTKKAPLLSLQQEIAENFYPLRADFTIKRSLGNDFAGSNMTSYPVLCQRDLQDQIGTMLRNVNKPWFKMVTKNMNKVDHDGKAWLEWATGTMRRAMYAPQTLFRTATSQADADFAAFGGPILQVRLNRMRDDLLFRTWHPRDVAYLEDEDGKICAVFRRWRPTLRTMVRLFGSGRPGTKVHDQVVRKAQKAPDEECDCYHFMVAADMFDGDARGLPWRSIYVDAQHDSTEMESVAQRRKEYVIPRWATVSGLQYGSQYPYSPATIAALPEARLLQAMTYTLLEAGEKVVNPPMVATEQVMRSDMAIYAGGTTWIEREYDQRTGAALQALTQDARGMPLSQEMQKDSRALIAQCFYLNRLTLPQRGPDMTAYEVGQRVQEYIRNALPLFEPMEPEYNGGLCEETFGCMFDAGGFGSVMDIPRSLRRAGEFEFRFSSPLHDAIEEQKGHKFLEVGQMLSQAVAMDKNAYAVVDVITAFRDALEATGTPSKWTRSEAESDQMIQSAAAKQQVAELLANMETAGGASKDIATAQSMAQPQTA